MRVPPIAALSTVQGGDEGSSRRRIIVGSSVGVLGIAVLALGLSKPAIELVGLGAVAIFVGVGMLAPLVARPMASVLGRPLALLGMPGRLGRENSMRSPRRTAQTSAALMVGLALVSAMSVFGASISSSATTSISDAISADYIVSASSTGGPPAGFSTAAQAQLRAVPGVSEVSTVYAGQFQIHHGVSTLAGIAASDLGSTITLRVVAGDATAALAGGALLIDSTQANKEHLSVGSVVPVLFADTGGTTLRIGAIYKPNAVLGSYLVGLGTFQSHFRADALPVAMLLKADAGPSASLTKALDASLSGYPNLKVQTKAQFEAAQQSQVNQLLGLVYVLLALAILIAMIGIVNTLMLSVFERTREIGLLRAVGMRRRQVRSMIRAESLILAVFGAVLGIVVGTGLGLALADSLKEQGITDVVVPYGSMVVFLVLAGLLGLAAASWPAEIACSE